MEKKLMNDPSTHGFHILSRAVISWSGSAVIHYHSTNFHGVFLLSAKPSSGPGLERQQPSVHILSLSPSFWSGGRPADKDPQL